MPNSREESTKRAYDEAATYYGEHRLTKGLGGVYDHFFDSLSSQGLGLRALGAGRKESETAKGLCFLDLGCGSGRLVHELVERKIPFATYLGVDYSEKTIDVAKEHHKGKQVTFRAGDITDPGAYTKSDIVTLFAVLHHIYSKEEQKAVLQNAWNAVEPGGLLYCTVWNMDEKLPRGAIEEEGVYAVPLQSENRYYYPFRGDTLQKLVGEVAGAMVHSTTKGWNKIVWAYKE